MVATSFLYYLTSNTTNTIVGFLRAVKCFEAIHTHILTHRLRWGWDRAGTVPCLHWGAVFICSEWNAGHLKNFSPWELFYPDCFMGQKAGTFTKRLYSKCWKKHKKKLQNNQTWNVKDLLRDTEHFCSFAIMICENLMCIRASKQTQSHGQQITHEPWDKNVYFFLVWQKKNENYQQVMWVFVMCRLTVGLPLLAQHLDVHRWVNPIKNFSPLLSGVFVASVDGSGLPVGPVERLVIKSKGEWVGERTLHDGLSASVNRYM